jgi:hypothetical protein
MYDGPSATKPTGDSQIRLSKAQVSALVKSLPKKKAPGPDGIKAEMYKYGGEHAINMLTTLLNAILEHGTIPKNMNMATICLIPKDKAKLADPSTYRPISLMNVALKVLDKHLKEQIADHIRENRILSEEQAGFRPNLSCLHHILTFEQVTQIAKTTQTPVHAIFIDLQKAFDSIDREQLLDMLVEMRFPAEVRTLTQMMYATESSSLSLNHTLQAPWPVNKGVRQGASSSPLLFNLFPELLIRQT